MVLYFLKEYFKIQSLPGNLIDGNVKIDYEKLKHLIIVDTVKGKTVNGNFERLREIIEAGETSSELIEGFPLEKLANRENFISLLFYFGLLTIKSVDAAEPVLSIPNETIRRLYYGYIKSAYEETGIFTLDFYRYTRLMKDMAMKGQWKPLFDYIAGLMRESMNLRDLITGEKSIQAFLHVYLGLSNFYIIHREREMNKGFADLIMEPFLARYEGIKYSYLLEIKYVKKGEKPDDVELKKLRSKAEAQLWQYSLDEKFRESIGERTTLVKLVFIFSGHELLSQGEV
jgi:hypothetical protein